MDPFADPAPKVDTLPFTPTLPYTPTYPGTDTTPREVTPFDFPIEFPINVPRVNAPPDYFTPPGDEPVRPPRTVSPNEPVRLPFAPPAVDFPDLSVQPDPGAAFDNPVPDGIIAGTCPPCRCSGSSKPGDKKKKKRKPEAKTKCYEYTNRQYKDGTVRVTTTEVPCISKVGRARKTRSDKGSKRSRKYGKPGAFPDLQSLGGF